MTSDPVKIEGYEELVAKFRALSASFRRKALRGVMTRGARPVVTAARKELDVRRTGALEKAISSNVKAIDDTHAEAHIGFRKRAFWGLFIELGTAFFRPHPFLRPALEKNRDKVLERMSTAFRAEIDKVIRRGGR